ncbi:hypothetical protein SpCBS45565_g07450 [Spizellomyces sp. 'palustris']|nr:hypothetical protein SpCBS45565_g07450 [Spizellomyces sp. 'palustris']
MPTATQSAVDHDIPTINLSPTLLPRWISAKANAVPATLAFPAGQEATGETLYISRGIPQNGSYEIVPGKAGLHLQPRGLHIGYLGQESVITDHQILHIPDPSLFEWVPWEGCCDTESLKAQGRIPLVGGRNKDGEWMFVAVAYPLSGDEGGLHPGRCGPGVKGAAIGYAGKEKIVDKYRVLCLRKPEK